MIRARFDRYVSSPRSVWCRRWRSSGTAVLPSTGPVVVVGCRAEHGDDRAGGTTGFVVPPDPGGVVGVVGAGLNDEADVVIEDRGGHGEGGPFRSGGVARDLRRGGVRRAG